MDIIINILRYLILILLFIITYYQSKTLNNLADAIKVIHNDLSIAENRIRQLEDQITDMIDEQMSQNNKE